MPLQDANPTPSFGGFGLKGNVIQKGYLAVTVPGTLMALHDVASRFATMPWKELLAPAIELAESGFSVQGELAASWVREGMLGYASTEDILKATPASAKIFAPNGRLLGAGETLVMKDYADTLRRVADEGADLLYRGEMGKAIAEDFARNGGLITEEDFRQYRLRVNSPLTVRLPRLHRLREPAARQRAADHRDPEHPGGLRPGGNGVRHARVLPRDGAGPEGRVR